MADMPPANISQVEQAKPSKAIEEIGDKLAKYKINYNDVKVAVEEAFPTLAMQIAVLGHIGRETDGTYDYKIKQYGGGPGRGLLQLEDGKYSNGVDKHFRNYNRWLTKNKLEDSAKSQVFYLKDNIMGSQREYNGFGNSKKIVESIKSNDPKLIAETLQERFFRSGKKLPQKTNDYMSFWTTILTPAK